MMKVNVTFVTHYLVIDYLMSFVMCSLSALMH